MFSDYIFTNEDHYFDNIKIKLYSSYEKEKRFALWWNYIYFDWNIELLNLEKVINNFFSNVSNLDMAYNSIYSSFFQVNDLEIIYNIEKDRFIFKFANNNNNIEIITKKSSIFPVVVNGEKISGISNISKLKDILLTIE